MNAAGRDGLAPRTSEEPAATITGKGTAAWVYRASNMPHAAVRPAPAPAPTIAFGHAAASAVFEDENDSRRVTVQEAAILQSVRPDYPWQGGVTKQFEQVGNIVPPLLAVAVIGHLLGLDWQPICRGWFTDDADEVA